MTPASHPQSNNTGTLGAVEPLDARKFMIAVKRLADSLSYGTDRSPFLGSGLEFAQSRIYEPGDPVKLIDWRVTARTGKLFVKEYETPKRMPVYLVVDTSASMVISSYRKSKYEIAVQVAGALALACLDRISPVGILGAGSKALHVPPSLSKDRVMQWLHMLRTYRHDESTELGKRLVELGPSLPNRVMLIVISDLHDPSSLPIIKRLGQRHDCCVLQMRDPAEEQLRRTGFYRGREAESGRVFIGHGRSRLLDPTAAKEALRRAGVDHLLLETDQPIAIRLRQFFAARGLLGKGAR
ncbi:hypothetical protein Enr13x_21030 [Stieleria neptunia]|uniref:DUF58 domain-containing protein n=1 Tax=Stieleria neptunia TaxID=2527979 RepID=A0A518HN35_9BACT|nr:DUF58 domain-containing protein [Stieleria neptunia]QDV42258.1 hypothetical protein Enr13x_21030 [Stieleria neptunia]